MEDRYCKECSHFYQHYGMGEGRVFRLYCGHCVRLTRSRHRKPDSCACENFEIASPTEDTFVDREYLSKALLNKVLDMKLLPDIEDALHKKK